MDNVLDYGWDAAKKHCREKFGFTPKDWQVRMWWFGSLSEKGKTQAQRQEIKEQRVTHRHIISAEVAPWDCVVRLAMDYTADVCKKDRERWTEQRICAMIYTLVWSRFQRYVDATDRSGKKFKGATFWMWCIERKNRYETVMNPTNTKNMKQGLRAFAQALDSKL